MNQRKFLRESMKHELKTGGKGLKKLLRKYNRKPTVHNQVCVTMNQLEDLR